MTETVISSHEPVLLPVHESLARFPVRRVFCVGRNYAAHSREMGHNPEREPPFFFMKPAEAVVSCPEGIETPVGYPPRTANLHHEVELAIALGVGGADVTPDEAMGLIWGYAVSIDLTRRDMQDEAKALRRPWDLSKGFDESAPIGTLVPAAALGHLTSGRISLSVDGELRQEGDLLQQIWSSAEIIAELSSIVLLKPGDIVLTGTPSGVGAIERGARLVGEIDRLPTLRCVIQ